MDARSVTNASGSAWKKRPSHVEGKRMNAERILERIEEELRRYTPRRVSVGDYELEAAVSLILRPSGEAVEFLAIKRADHQADPWSGHMALPGGRREPGDSDLWATAVRETREEVGLRLDEQGRRLGRLSDVLPRSRQLPAIAITPFVAAIGRGPEPRPGPEVQHSLWVPVDVLLDERYEGRFAPTEADGREFVVVEYGGEVIWGLTLSILSEMREVVRRALGAGGRR